MTPRGLAVRHAAAACGLAAGAFALGTPLLAGLAQTAYDPCSQFISELGQAGAPHATRVRFAGFLPTGLLTLSFTLLSAAYVAPTPRARSGLLLFSAVGWAYLAAAFFPCDPGCPPLGSTSQQIHDVFGTAEYLAGGAGLVLLATSRRAPSSISGFERLTLFGSAIVFGAFIGMLLPQLAPVRGLVQRGAESALFLWIVACSVRLWGTGAPGGLGDDPSVRPR